MYNKDQLATPHMGVPVFLDPMASSCLQNAKTGASTSILGYNPHSQNITFNVEPGESYEF